MSAGRTKYQQARSSPLLLTGLAGMTVELKDNIRVPAVIRFARVEIWVRVGRACDTAAI
jgi:hypothetical protein